MKVVIYGAGGPVAKAAVKSIENRHVLRLTDLDIHSLRAYDDRHEKLKCDIAQEEEVVQTAAGMDAIINCTVLRDHPVVSFDVNCRGAYNVMRAAKAHGIRRVIHTGPQLIHSGHMGDYMTDWDLPEEVPPRPGTAIYLVTKYLGQEICRIFAEEEGIPVITLLFSNFVDSAKSLAQQRLGRGFYPYTVSWDDTGESFRCALEVGELPRPFEIFDILADIPHGVLSPSKAKRLLGWQPKDNFEADWKRQAEPASADKR
jgi:nucleoside-diphosphate-sugar epimerase